MRGEREGGGVEEGKRKGRGRAGERPPPHTKNDDGKRKPSGTKKSPPSLGQAALLIHRPSTYSSPDGPPFWAAIPPHPVVYWPVFATTVAISVVASQALISAAFAIVKQGQGQGFMPRLQVIHTSKHHEGQIYIPAINWVSEREREREREGGRGERGRELRSVGSLFARRFSTREKFLDALKKKKTPLSKKHLPETGPRHPLPLGRHRLPRLQRDRGRVRHRGSRRYAAHVRISDVLIFNLFFLLSFFSRSEKRKKNPIPST